ncbi:hypothetical protein ROZALSC1DRAFT_29424 [Rozella allomycis CSF55]|uniref:Transcriptional activator HAP2 n=1 Tax=Rozella allomycis (strain CSF55) TaxID=988480 RepID=A0A075AQC5_ROZAC|nr:CCAAT-binding transcription factor, subunit B domain-containing protein [Rozella allomycis CSF55]RKP18925.1 hypothetical protein ROZALSC1DRAFT_29424 [Rozella allomycis CSF55]|eukprot:EPZ32418.1 CCAAT-binding transcription factor, subunit B domain-containing protein [Rozella allomycis CSF55]
MTNSIVAFRDIMMQRVALPATVVEEEPMYVNAKQYQRILKRRIARAKYEAARKKSMEKKPYLHESRHKHAMRRLRGPGGRFLTAAEIAEMKKKEKEQSEAGGNQNREAQGQENSSERGRKQQ